MVTSKKSADEQEVTIHGNHKHSLHRTTTESAEPNLLTHEDQRDIHVEETLSGRLVLRPKSHENDPDDTEHITATGLYLYHLVFLLQEEAGKQQTTLRARFEYRILHHPDARGTSVPCAILVEQKHAKLVLKILNREKPDRVPNVPPEAEAQ